jgi:ABC-2 type transport system permease protein
MRYLRLVAAFMRASALEEAAYRLNFWISLLHSLLNLGLGVLGVVVLFGQVENVRGWTFGSTLALLGVYLTAGALRNLFIGPSLDSLVGMDGDVWSGRLDFTLLRPIDIQFFASLRRWRLFAGLDLSLALGVLAVAVLQTGVQMDAARLGGFLLALGVGVAILYAILLALTALVFWSPGTLFTWLFDGLFQLARYPTGLYPGWLRLVLTWVVPVGLITTLPAEALTGVLPGRLLAGGLVLAAAGVALSSAFFRLALCRYASASS